ncbi:Hypothetical predicted protein [Mytilus galloprovincialis]|uniref:Uncharacterized protein n=1 Tax=Mytilus galloprovincialis TaxID=29158 RepID=A0A8B6E3C0_MYTGA|nr:Hypothetical predicted protein [Mytilus galloprovincialis]
MGVVLSSNIRHRDHHIYQRKVYRRSKLQHLYILDVICSPKITKFPKQKGRYYRIYYSTNIDVSQDNLEEAHKEEHVLDNEEDIEEVTEENHVVDHEKDHMEDIEDEHKVFQSALDKLSDEGKRERFFFFFISGRFPLKQHCIRPVFGHC